MSLQLDDELTCSVCLELYVCPLTLPCLHTFCSECLRELTQSSNGLTIVCPQCRVDTPIPIGGVGKFPKNFNLENIIQKVKLHKEKEGSSNTESWDPTQVNPSKENDIGAVPPEEYFPPPPWVNHHHHHPGGPRWRKHHPPPDGCHGSGFRSPHHGPRHRPPHGPHHHPPPWHHRGHHRPPPWHHPHGPPPPPPPPP
ncbi:uncharacterized protein LOC111104786 [Crassostrea virginica]